jgi:hypothetical protein
VKSLPKRGAWKGPRHRPRNAADRPRHISSGAIDGRSCAIGCAALSPSPLAQRVFDFTAGGTFSLNGHQERIGESIYLFAPKAVNVEMASDSEGDLIKLAGGAGMLLKERKPAKEEQAASEQTPDSESDSQEKAFPASQLPAASPQTVARAQAGPQQSPEPNEGAGWQSQSEDEPPA